MRGNSIREGNTIMEGDTIMEGNTIRGGPASDKGMPEKCLRECLRNALGLG